MTLMLKSATSRPAPGLLPRCCTFAGSNNSKASVNQAPQIQYTTTRHVNVSTICVLVSLSVNCCSSPWWSLDVDSTLLAPSQNCASSPRAVAAPTFCCSGTTGETVLIRIQPVSIVLRCNP